MGTSRKATMRHRLSLVALFLGAFSVTWALRQQPRIPSAPTPQALTATDASRSSAGPGFPAAGTSPQRIDENPEGVEADPSLQDLAADGDPGVRAEARTLLALLEEESRLGY